MVNAPECSPEALLASIRTGQFYSSCGPEFYAIEYDQGKIRLRTSPVRFVRLAGPRHSGKRIGSFDGDLLSEASFEIPADWPYAYLEIEDEGGCLAWTNPLFVAET
jgi:hypothetical protein